MAPEPADRAVLERVIAESEVDVSRNDPGWASYVGDLIRRLSAELDSLLHRFAEGAGISAGIVSALVWTLAALAVIALVAAAVAAVRRRRRAAAAAAPSGGAGAAEPILTGFDWRAEIDRRLAAGRIAEALEAAWHWLARTLCGERAERSWTGGELVARSGRPDVAPAVARLDAWTYGPRRPAAGDVAGLVESLERRLTEAPGTGAVAP